MDQVKLIPMARKQLEQAVKTLQNEMRQFFAERSNKTLSELERVQHERDDLGWDYGWEDDPDWGSYNNQYDEQRTKRQTEQWSSPESWETFTNTWGSVAQGIRQRADSSKVNSRLDEDRRLLETVQLLADKLNEAFEKVAQQAAHPLAILTDQANLLRVFTEISAVYRTAWEQRHPTDYSDWGSPSERDLSDVILVGDRIVDSFYDIVREKGLDLVVPDQKIIVVPHRSRMYASGFDDLPMPYIVAPRFGSEQIWTWLAYVHEVGHHVYRNVKGLSDELVVNVMMALGNLGKDLTMQSIWFRWLEEIFADLFGLLQIGRALADSQQRMLLYLPPRVMAQLSTDDDLREGLLRAPDDTHPPAYLRAHLAIEALRIINTHGSEEEPQELEKREEKLQELENRWDDFFREGPDVDTTNLYLPVQGEYQKSSRQEMNAGDADDDTNDTVTGECHQKFHCQEMKDIGKTVLEVMLTTKLYALGMKLTSDEPDLPSKRSLIDVFRSPLDEEEVRQAQESINGAALSEVRVAAEAIRIPEVGVAEETIRIPDFQHLLTAAQDKLEQLTTNLTADGKDVVHESRRITTPEGVVVQASKLIPVDKAIEELSDSVFSVLAERAGLEKNG